jgi:hypothetical protein
VKGGQVQIIDHSVEKTADDIAEEFKAAMQQGKGRKPKELIDAENWLRDFLADDRKPVGNENNPAPGTVRYESERAPRNESGQVGHDWSTLKRAKKTLGVVSCREMNVWFCSLPKTADSTRQEGQNSFSEKQEGQNAFLESSSTESQCNDHSGETGQEGQNSVCSGNSGLLGQDADSGQENMNIVPDSNVGETDEISRHKVKAQRRPKPTQPEQKPEVKNDRKTLLD